VKEISALMERFFDSYVISTSFEGDNLNNNILADIQSRYHLSRFPYRIECIDISHLSGGWISGGLSCFVEGLKNPKGYRRYKIK
jgi:excinuclease ABC subunit C